MLKFKRNLFIWHFGLRFQDMNEPSSFVNGAVGGCRTQELNFPPYVPRKFDPCCKLCNHLGHSGSYSIFYMLDVA